MPFYWANPPHPYITDAISLSYCFYGNQTEQLITFFSNAYSGEMYLDNDEKNK